MESHNSSEFVVENVVSSLSFKREDGTEINNFPVTEGIQGALQAVVNTANNSTDGKAAQEYVEALREAIMKADPDLRPSDRFLDQFNGENKGKEAAVDAIMEELFKAKGIESSILVSAQKQEAGWER